MANSIQHVNVMVDDLDAATEFYRDVLGLELSTTPELGFPAQFFAVGDGQEIHVNELPDRHPERAHFCIRVENWNEVFKRALDRGLFDTETWGMAKRLPTGVMQAFVRDPTGNLIELACDPSYPVDPEIFELDFVDETTA